MKTSSGPESVRQRLNRFGIVTSVAVGLLALARPAEAKIVYTPANIKIRSYNLDLNHDGVTDFTLSTSHALTGPGGSFKEIFVETPASDNGAEGSLPTRLIEGDQIGPSQTFYGGMGTMASLSANGMGGASESGNWIADYKGLHGHLGLMFQINGETHYGWAGLTVTSFIHTVKTSSLCTPECQRRRRGKGAALCRSIGTAPGMVILGWKSRARKVWSRTFCGNPKIAPELPE